MKHIIPYLLLILINASVLGQSPAQHEKQQISEHYQDKAEIKFTSDLSCNLYIDGELKGKLVPDAVPLKVALSKGQYRIKAMVIDDTTMVCSETMEIKSENLGTSTYKEFPLRSFIENRKRAGFSKEVINDEAPPLPPSEVQEPAPVIIHTRTQERVPNLETTEQQGVKVYSFVEQQPQFPGGDGAMMNFLAKNIIYPQMERDNDIQGKVLTRFIINEDGSISDVVVTHSISPGLDKEAVRVIKMFPRFSPARQGGVPVKVYFNLPVVFHLG